MDKASGVSRSTWMITGCTSGLGASLARAVLERGWNAVVTARHPEQLQPFAQAYPERALILPLDVTDRQAIAQAVEQAQARFGRVDVLVNNAGAAEEILFSEVEEDHWDYILDSNLKSAYRMIHGLLPAFYRQQGGVILNISSVWGQVGAACEAAYSAAKAGLIGLTKALAKELALGGIRVNCIAPGGIDTPMNAGYTREELSRFCESVPMGRMGKPEEVAAAAVFLASDSASYITGQVLGVNGGMV